MKYLESYWRAILCLTEGLWGYKDGTHWSHLVIIQICVFSAVKDKNISVACMREKQKSI